MRRPQERERRAQDEGGGVLHAEDAAQLARSSRFTGGEDSCRRTRGLTENRSAGAPVYAIPGDGDEVQEACEGSSPQGR